MRHLGETPSRARCVVCGYDPEDPEDPDGIFQEELNLYVCFPCFEPVQWLIARRNAPEVALDCVQSAFGSGQDIELCRTCRRPLVAQTVASDGAFLYCEACLWF